MREACPGLRTVIETQLVRSTIVFVPNHPDGFGHPCDGPCFHQFADQVPGLLESPAQLSA